MTTIAFDGRTLAGDTQHSMFRGNGEKVFCLNDGSLFGSCGQIQDGAAVREWLASGGEKPKVEDGFHAIFVKDGRLYSLENKLVHLEQRRPFFAIGSGRDYAMAAMFLGKTAADAVRVAHEFDVDTGDAVTELSIAMPAPALVEEGSTLHRALLRTVGNGASP